jgi:hypothetical protein
MPTTDGTFTSTEAIVPFVIVAMSAFLVTWIVAALLKTAHSIWS